VPTEQPTRPVSRGPISFLLRYIRKRTISHSIVFLSVIVAVCCNIGSQYAVRTLVNVLGHPSPAAFAIYGAVALLLGLVAADTILWRVAGWTSAKAFVGVGGDMRLDLFTHLSGQDARYFQERFPGALASRITTAANVTWTIENSLTWMTIPPAASVIASIIVLGTVNWPLMVTLIVIVGLLGTFIGRLATRGREVHYAYAGTAAKVSGDLTDTVSNITLVRAFGAERREHERLRDSINKEMIAQRASLQTLERLRLLHAVSVFVVTAGILIWSVELWRRGQISTGDVVLTTTLGFTVLHASRDFALAIVDMLQHMAKLAEAVQELSLPYGMQDLPDAQPLRVDAGTISFRNVTFRYLNGRTVLRDFTLSIAAGEKVGITGRSGAGKTTVGALLQRLYDPDAGEVLIDGQNIVHVTQESLRCSIAVVQQDISLFNRTLMENLRYGRPDASDEEVHAAVEAAQCSDIIRKMPDGFDTMVGERGMKLSGGQRQRLAIARAFLLNAPIVLLDEATSALDTESELAIQEALSKLFRGRTVIAIAHRLSTINDFDRVIVIDRGQIIDQGPPKELLSQAGAYRRMYNRQAGLRKVV
jgi:ATP-binding cassette subfamily B protein